MADWEAQKSREFVALRVEGAAPSDAVEVLDDGGAHFAVVRRDTLDADALARSLPVHAIPGTDEFELATGTVTVRWDGDAGVLADYLSREDAELIRDYGAGGVVASRKAVDPFDLAHEIERIDGVRSVTVNTLRKAHRR